MGTIGLVKQIERLRKNRDRLKRLADKAVERYERVERQLTAINVASTVVAVEAQSVDALPIHHGSLLGTQS